jgi:Flp pilus assembly protein TadG
MNFIPEKLISFIRDERGNVLAETVVILPIVIWSYLAFFVYWDAYKTTNVAQKAAYTVADLISREQATLPTTYIPGMLSLLRYLVEDQTSTKIRVTSLLFTEGATVKIAEDDADDKTTVQWSISPNNAMVPYTNATLLPVLNKIPAMFDGDSVILVETSMDFKPMFDVGMASRQVTNFVVTRPRFLPKICMTGFTC